MAEFIVTVVKREENLARVRVEAEHAYAAEREVDLLVIHEEIEKKVAAGSGWLPVSIGEKAYTVVRVKRV